jgi:membrane protein
MVTTPHIPFSAASIGGLLLFSFASVAWLVAVALSVFGRPIEQWITSEFGNSSLVRNFLIVTLPVLAMILAMFVLALIYRVARPVTTTWRSVLPGAAAATILWWGVNSLFGIYVWKIQFGPVYGGLAAAIGLMAWMEISAMLVFVGAAWNSESATRTILSQPSDLVGNFDLNANAATVVKPLRVLPNRRRQSQFVD